MGVKRNKGFIKRITAIIITFIMIVGIVGNVPMKEVRADYPFPITGHFYVYNDDDGVLVSQSIRWELKTGGPSGGLIMEIGDNDTFQGSEGAQYTAESYKKVARDNRHLITAVVIDYGVKFIPDACFCEEGVFDLRSVKIPTSLLAIGKSAFEGNTHLTQLYGANENLNDPSGEQGVADGLFKLPANVVSVESNAFKNCGFSEVQFEGMLETIPFGMFWFNSNLTKVTLPSGLEKLDDYAFCDCNNLSGEIELPSTLKYLGSAVFAESKVSGSVNLPEGLEHLDNAYHGCSNITGSVKIPASVTEIRSNACLFEGTSISSVEYVGNDTQDYIPYGTFSGMKKLTTVTVGSKVKYIAACAFETDTSLTTVRLSEGLKGIGGAAFEGCTSLKNINLPSTLQYMGLTYDQGTGRVGTFQNTGLTEITIPASVRFISNQAFYNCTSLTKVIFEGGTEDLLIGLPSAGESADTLYKDVSWIKWDESKSRYVCTELISNYDIDLTWIDSTYHGSAFENCVNLTSADLPSNVKYVGRATFKNTKVKKKMDDTVVNPDEDKTGDGSTEDKSQDGSSGDNTSQKPDDSSSTDKKPAYSNEWHDGKWYNEDGTVTYEGTMSWKKNSTGWWIEDSTGWYPQSQWQKIDGYWYYFGADGYMASNEWRDGYWLGLDGAMDDAYFMTWKSDSTGWWIEDKTGWYPQNQWQKINGSWYYFKSDGYMATSQYVDSWWVGSDGIYHQ